MSYNFVWKIENFSYCWPRTGDVLRSPKFISSEFNFMRWTLSLYPRGRRKAEHIDCRLTRDDTEQDFETDVELEFSFLNGAGMPLKRSDKIRRGFAIGEFQEYSINREDVFQSRQAFLPHDTLTLRCRVWLCDMLYDPQFTFATTHIRVERISFVWTVEEFSSYDKDEEKITPVTSVSEGAPDFRLRLCPKSGTDGTVSIRIIQLGTDRENFVRCRMSLLAKNNSEVGSKADEQWYHRYRPKNPWIFPAFISRDKLLKNKEVYLPGDVLSLRCELNVSMGEWKSGDIVRPSRTPDVSTSTTGCQTEILPVSSNGEDRNLEDDLRRLYRDRLLCDFTLRAGSETFPVHKSLLVARSPVFRAMFQKGMLDDKSGTLEIPDLDPGTLKRMLAFIYCEEMERSGWKHSAKLYSAADKYHLLPLKEECRELLKAGLDTSNAWEVLLLADQHQDEDLRKTVQEFILAQEKSIIESEGGRKAKRGKPPTTLHDVYLSVTSKSQH